jgi:hypothetical protein
MCVGAIRVLSGGPWKVGTAVVTMMKLSISYGQQYGWPGHLDRPALCGADPDVRRSYP